MDSVRKKRILEMVEDALDTTPFGKIIIELRGPDSSADVVIEQRTRVYQHEEKPSDVSIVKMKAGFRRG